jgi:hypothetical protein
MHECVHRCFAALKRDEGSIPPRDVLLEFCRILPGCDVKGHDITKKGPIDWRSIIHEKEEQALFFAFHKHKGPLSPKTIISEALAFGIKSKDCTFRYLRTSPIVRKLAFKRYVLYPNATE